MSLIHGVKVPVLAKIEVGVATAVATLIKTLSLALQPFCVTVHLYQPVVVTFIEAVVAFVFHK